MPCVRAYRYLRQTTKRQVRTTQSLPMFQRWGGWGSDPRPTDYESSPPAALAGVSDLGRHELTRSWLRPFGHVFGMIKLDADPVPRACNASRRSLLRTVVDLRAVIDIENVDHAAALIDPVDDAIGAAPGAMTAGKRP